MSKLSSLLQYRFKKRGDSKSGSQSSENSSDSSLNGSATQSPSQTSTQPPRTPDKRPNNLHVTPDGKTLKQSESMSSPDSPIFGHKPKLVDRNWNATPEKSSSTASSPWLSKENGALSNGNVKQAKKSARKFASFSDEEDSNNDEEVDEVVSDILDLDHKVVNLRPMFPARAARDVRAALIQTKGDVEEAIDLLIEEKGKSNFKRIRPESQDSISDPDTPIQPRKRIRKISSDSEDDAGVSVTDSQLTVPYGLDSQRSDATVIYDVEEDTGPLSSAKQKQIEFLQTCFKGHSEKDLRRVLSEHNWVIADATVALSASTTLKAVTSENKVRSKAAATLDENNDVDLDDEDDDYDSEAGSDDSVEEEGDEGKNVILSFYDDATIEELMATPGCSKKKAEVIVQNRPFSTWTNMVEKFVTVKGLNYDLISGCKEVIKIRDTVIKLMKRCESISSTMEVVANQLNSNTQLDDEKHITKQPSNLNPDMQLKPFQMVGLNWLRIMNQQGLNGILADEMGLGKTIQTIAFIAHLLEEGQTGPHVIIVPSSTIDNWIRESKTWCPSMKVLVYYGSQEDRRATRQYIMYNSEEFNVIITTYNMATGNVDDRALFKKFEFHYAIFDEGHLLKNMSSLRYQNLMRINAHGRLLLTGTPLQNNLLELMSLLCFVMPDMFVGKTEQLKRMFTMISRTGNDEKRSKYEQERIAHAKRIMKPFVLRRLKSEVMSQLPKKSEEVKYCTMIPDQQEVYDNLITNFSCEMNEEGQMSSKGAGAGAAMLMQLRKASNHPLLHRSHYTKARIQEMAEVLCEEPSHKDRGALPKLISEDMLVMSDFELHKCCVYYKHYMKEFLLDESLMCDSGKFRVISDLLDKHREAGDRVLLFSQFTSLMDIAEVFLKSKNIRFLRLDGSTPVPERQRLIDDYNNDTDIYVFLLSTKAGGLGINLTSANVVILHDIDFNPYNDKQAEDRCHRVGQTRPVQIIRLISKGTVEEAMLKCAREKLKLERDVISTDDADEESDSKNVASILKQALHKTMKS